MCVSGLPCLYAFPNAVPPPGMDVSGYAGFAMLQGVDANGNACPSLHVATTVFTAIWVEYLLRHLQMPWGLRAGNALWCAAIVYSTLATKQHVALDVLAGAALGTVFALAAQGWRGRGIFSRVSPLAAPPPPLIASAPASAGFAFAPRIARPCVCQVMNLLFPGMRRSDQNEDCSRSRHSLRKSIRILFLMLLLVTGFGLLVGCGSWTVTPPARPVNPSTVFISQYGLHSRVAVQVGPTRMVEYGYGDWRYYAEGEKGPWRGVVAIATPTAAALGKRSLHFTGESENFLRQAGADRTERLEVELARVKQLVGHLEGRYQANMDTAIHPSDSPFSFVKDELSYHLAHNSNHQTADWLRRLGCEVRGNPVYANFRVIEPSR